MASETDKPQAPNPPEAGSKGASSAPVAASQASDSAAPVGSDAGPGSSAGQQTSGSKASSQGSSGTASSRPKDARGASALDESALERSIIRRGLSTPQELAYCKQQRDRIQKEKGEPVNLLQVLVAAKALTESQGRRLFQEVAADTQSNLAIPGYQIIEKLGKGSMGVVYKAKQLSVDRVVAIKILLDQLSENRDFIRRFDREAKIAAKLSNAHVVQAIDAGEANGRYFFVMEYVEGDTIKDFLDKGKRFDERSALKIAIAVAEALKHAHSKGLIHRDVKPENVILTKDGGVKLADLGLARLTSDEKWALAEAGMAIGTPYYISPEQVRGQVDVDIRCDIYSLGATLYHMVTGQVPYSGETPQEVMKKHVSKEAVLTPPDHLNKSLSNGLGVVVETMMAKDRNERYLTPEDLILDLKSLLAGDAPMVASQKMESLSALADGGGGDEDEDDGMDVSTEAWEAEKEEIASYVNGRTNIIAGLAVLLGLSVVTNILVLAIK